MLSRRVNASKAFFFVLALTLLLRVLVAALFPVFGDEAYYLAWARELRPIYYDQPPMIGWWLWALSGISRSAWFLRLPVVLLSIMIAAGGWALLRGQSAESRERALLGGMLVLSNVFFTLPMVMTTDVPLVFFSVLSVGAILLGIRSERRTWFVVAGACIGLGLLSKYFVALLVPAYFVHGLRFSRNRRKALLDGVILLVVAAPFAAFYLYANYQECWVNFLFNFSSRHGAESFNLTTPGKFLLYQLLLASPLLVWPSLRAWRQLGQGMASPELSWLALSFAVPMAAFAASSLKYGQGLHWGFSFYPALFFFLAFTLPLKTLRFWGGMQISLSLLVSVAGAGIVLSPAQWWIGKIRGARDFQRVRQLPLVGPGLEDRIAEDPARLVLSDSYSEASSLAYHLDRSVYQFANLSKFGRNDDLVLDLSQHAGRDVLFVTRSVGALLEAQKYFVGSQTEVRKIGDTVYHLGLLRKFDFAKYRDVVLERIRTRYYRWPEALPPAACSFTDAHFPRQ